MFWMSQVVFGEWQQVCRGDVWQDALLLLVVVHVQGLRSVGVVSNVKRLHSERIRYGDKRNRGL